LISGFDFRDWLLANDPALSRLRMGSRVTLSILLSFAILLVIHMFIVPLPTASYGLGIVLSIEGGVAVRDKGSTRQLITRLLGCLASLVVVGIAAALESHRVLSDFIFLAVIFLASVARVYGPRGFAIGMFAFTSYFLGSYFQPKIAQLPLVLIGPVVSALVSHWVRAVLLPDNWRRDLLRSLESVRGRINQILFKLAVLATAGKVEEADRQELRQLEDRLKEVVLMTESFIPRPPGGVFDGASDPAAELAIRLFDAHLAAESATVLSYQSPPPFALVHAVIEDDRTALSAQEQAIADVEGQPQAETTRALLWLGAARRQLADTIETGRRTDFIEIASVEEVKTPTAIDFSLQNPVIRSALQITLAAAIAMTFGLALSRERWFWAVLASFLVFTNTNSRGDTAIKALQRSIGTLFGIAFGLVLASLLAHQMDIAIAVSIVCVFLAFYFLQSSYATMTFFISIVLCLVYGMMGVLTFDLLKLRLEETVIGAVAGTLVAFLVFPARTRGALDTAVAKWFSALKELLSAVSDQKSQMELMAISQKVDACYRDITLAARPLGSTWSIVTRPGQIRQTLAIFLSVTYWSRILGRNNTDNTVDEDLKRRIAADIRRLDAVALRGSECFLVIRKQMRPASRHLPLWHEGTRLAIDMIGSTLERLYPAEAQDLPVAAGNAIAPVNQE
jgi:uncharacterized membrane protein YccC